MPRATKHGVFRPLLAAGLVAAALGCGAARPGATDDGPAATPTARPAARGVTMPALALAYAPGDEPTERMIGRAQEALRADPDNPARHGDLARAMLRRARETSHPVYMRYAEDVLRSADAHGWGDEADLLALRIATLQDRHRFVEAAQASARLVAQRPHDPTGHLLLGDARLELGDYEGAADAYQAAMDLHPDLRSYNRAAHLRWIFGDADGALALLELAIDAGSARDPEAMAWCFVDLAQLYLLRGDAARANAAADRALALVEGYVPALVAKARARARSGDRAEAIALYGDAVTRHPTVEDLLALADLLHADGQEPVARVRRAQAEALSEDDPRPFAHALARDGLQIDRALELSARELSVRKTIAGWDTRALVLLRAGRIDEAQAAIDAALAYPTADAQLYLHAGLIAAAAGDRSGARQHLDHAVAMDAGVEPALMAELVRAVEAG